MSLYALLNLTSQYPVWITTLQRNKLYSTQPSVTARRKLYNIHKLSSHHHRSVLNKEFKLSLRILQYLFNWILWSKLFENYFSPLLSAVGSWVYKNIHTLLISYKDGEGDKIWHLYSCGGEGTILEHNPEHLHGEAKNVDKLIKATNDIKVPLACESELFNWPLVSYHIWISKYQNVFLLCYFWRACFSKLKEIRHYLSISLVILTE